MQILIADDDPVAAKVLHLTLKRLGHAVVITRSGTEAWEAFDRQPQRLIVSNWMMPGLDGLEFCRKVRTRQNTAYAYFILLTALDTSVENLKLATEAGADDFLTKPLQRTTIHMRLRVAERILSFTREIGQLRELIPICSWCHRVRQDRGYWERVEEYVGRRTGARITHGLCPECVKTQLAQLDGPRCSTGR
jgi:sigma-B regulation protein RsbU (phosphoserine phosphatase)